MALRRKRKRSGQHVGGSYKLPQIPRNTRGIDRAPLDNIKSLASMLKKLEGATLPSTDEASTAGFNSLFQNTFPTRTKVNDRPESKTRVDAVNIERRTKLLSFAWEPHESKTKDRKKKRLPAAEVSAPCAKEEPNALSLLEDSYIGNASSTPGHSTREPRGSNPSPLPMSEEKRRHFLVQTNKLAIAADPANLYTDLASVPNPNTRNKGVRRMNKKQGMTLRPLASSAVKEQRKPVAAIGASPDSDSCVPKPSRTAALASPPPHAAQTSRSLPAMNRIITPPRPVHPMVSMQLVRRTSPVRARKPTPLEAKFRITEKQYHVTKSAHQRLTTDIFHAIDEFSHRLPEAMVVRYGMGKEAKRRAMANFDKIFSAWVLRCFIGPRFEKWVWFKENAVFLEQTAAAIQMQRYGRGFLGRLRLYNKRYARRKHIDDVHAGLQRYVASRKRATLLLQRIVRGRQGRKSARFRRLQVYSASVLQRFWLSTAAKRLCARMRYKRDTENAAASLIQRCWQGYQGRRQFWEELKQKKSALREEKLSKKEFVMRAGFERLGADLKIQRWWRNLLWRKSFAERIITTEKNRCAVAIQTEARRFLGRRKFLRVLKKYVSGQNLNYPPNLSIGTKRMKGMVLEALALHWTQRAERKVAYPPVKIEFTAIKSIGRSPVTRKRKMREEKRAQAAPSESRSRAALIYWRRRGDRHLVKARKRVRNEKGMSAADRRLVGAPFDFNALQIAGSEALAEKRYKRAAVLLRRAMLYEENLILVDGFNKYFKSRRCGMELLAELYEHPNTLAVDDEYIGENEYWAFCGYAHYKIWLKTRSYKMLEIAHEAFQIALTYASNIKERYLLASARVATQWGDFESGLQSLAVFITEFPTHHDLGEVIFLAACALRQSGAFDQACEYFTSLMNDPPSGLSEAHILLQLARTRMEQGNGEEAYTAAMEIYSTRKRRRQIPRGIGTMQAYFSRPDTWMAFAKDYEASGHDLAAADAYSEALRIALAEDWGAVTSAFSDTPAEGDGEESEPGAHASDGFENPSGYTPKEGFTIADAHDAALRIQTRYRVHRGQLGFQLKMQAKRALEKQMGKLEELCHVMYRTGQAWVNVGRVVEAVTLLNRVYELSGDTVRQCIRLNMRTPGPIEEAFHQSATIMAHLRVAQDQARAYDPDNAPLTPFFAALQIQRYFRRRAARLLFRALKRNRAAKVLQYKWVTRYDRYGLGQFRARVKATRMLQKNYRGRLARLFMREVNRKREVKRRAAQLTQAWYRRHQAIRYMAARRAKMRIMFEELRVGHARYLKTRDRVIARLLLDHTNGNCNRIVSSSLKYLPHVRYKNGRKRDKCLLQMLFDAITSTDHTSTESGNAQIGEQMYKNFLQKTSVLTKKLVQNKADILFAKVMVGVPDRGLDLHRFSLVLRELGNAKYGGKIKKQRSKRSTQIGGKTKRSPDARRQSSFAKASAPVQVDTFVYNSFKGEDGRFVKVLFESVLTSKSAWCKAAKGDIHNAIDKRLTYSVVMIQTWFRGVTGKGDALAYRKRLLQQAKDEAVRNACAKIQSLWRQYGAKCRVQALVKSVCRKFLHYESQEYYWWNPRTKLEWWTKPLVFGSSDINHVIEMPPPEQLYTLTCGQCNDTADRHCNDCDDDFCKSCFLYIHSKGKRKEHVPEIANICVECSFQIASRICKTCDDYFCDWCYEMKHKSGRLRHHPWENVLPMCAACPPPRHEELMRALSDVKHAVTHNDTLNKEDMLITQQVQYVARWHCAECDEELCNECCQREKHVGHTINALGFQNEDIVTQRRLEAEQKRKEKEREKKAAEEAKVLLRRQNLAAEYLQRVWRGRQHRMWGKRYMQSQRDERLQNFRANQKERRYRASFRYKAKAGARMVFITFPYFLYKLVRGRPLSKAERNAKAKEKQIENERDEIMCVSAKQIDIAVRLVNGSEEVVALDKKWTDIVVTEGGKAKRKLSPNDRLRIVIDGVMHDKDSTIAAIKKTDEAILLLSREWDGTNAMSKEKAEPSKESDGKASEGSDEEPENEAEDPTPEESDGRVPIRIWWMPQITEDEVNERHAKKVKKDKRLRKQAEKAKNRAERFGSFADMFDETSFVGKYLNNKVNSWDDRAQELEDEMAGKKMVGGAIETKAEGEEGRGGYDEVKKGGLESLGLVQTVKLKKRMSMFKKRASANLQQDGTLEQAAAAYKEENNGE